MLKTLPVWLCFRFRICRQQKITPPMTSAAPMMDPMTIPAMAPPDRPVSDLLPPFSAPAVELGDAEDVLEGKTGGIDTVVGRFTPTHRVLTFALTQQESVEFVVLSAQKAHSP